jgi:hypothetical protein
MVLDKIVGDLVIDPTAEPKIDLLCLGVGPRYVLRFGTRF